MEVLIFFYILPHAYIYGAIINFPIILVHLSVIVFSFCHKLGPHLTCL